MRCSYCCLLLLFCSTSGRAEKDSCFFASSQKSNGYLAVLDARRAVAFSRGDVTSVVGQPAVLRQQAPGKTHTAKLTWKASSSHVAGYNVYRSEVSGQKYQKINSSLVQGLTYTDNTVLSGVTYYYVTRAVDDQGHESANSNETTVSVP
jgi:hypothetical protein